MNKTIGKIILIGGLAGILLAAPVAAKEKVNAANMQKPANISSVVNAEQFNIKYGVLYDGCAEINRLVEEDREKTKTTGVLHVGLYSSYVEYGYAITVCGGNTLSSIATELSRQSGKKITWQDLYLENKNIIGENPDLIKPRQQLKYRTGGGSVNFF